MNRKPVFTHRLNERGDLVRVEVAPNGSVETSPNPPAFKAKEIQPSKTQIKSTPAVRKEDKVKDPPIVTPEKITKDMSAIKIEDKTTSPTSPAALRLYADRDIHALEKNPMHNDIMHAAEAFKDRRETTSVNRDINSMSGHEKASEEKQATDNSVQSNADIDVRWTESKPYVKKNTYKVVPNSSVPSYLANAQENQDQHLTSQNEAAKPTKNSPYKRIEDIPDVDTLLELMATHDEKGKAIPEWKRKLMARNYRVKLCNEL